MNWFTGCVLYVLIWWTALFAVLPLWTRPVADLPADQGGWRGTPEQPRIMRKIVTTTFVAAVIWVGCYLVITSHYLSFRSGWLYMPDK